MPQTSSFTFLDRGSETSVHTLFMGAITAVSLPGFLTDFGTYKAALAAITLGTIKKERWVGDDTLLSSVPPVSNLAQRESKFLVSYVGDTSQKTFTLEIPTADLAGITFSAGDEIDLTVAPMPAFVAAFEQLARSPDDNTETVTILTVRHIGRNL